MKRPGLFLGFLLIFSLLANANELSNQPYLKAQINPFDKASIQRGAKLTIKYCINCHSLHFLRYNSILQEIGIEVVKPGDLVKTSMLAQDAKQWFGVSPPDLSLEARIRSADWLFSYLMSFYKDPTQIWGSNNLMYPQVKMPNVLLNLQGEQEASFRQKTVVIDNKSQTIWMIDHLVLTKPGEQSPKEFAKTVNDIVNFLTYAAEPIQTNRIYLGFWVVGFLALLATFIYLLLKITDKHYLRKK
ncbi:MAG: cytochrome c1 [Gammaproteobacteria bacterium]